MRQLIPCILLALACAEGTPDPETVLRCKSRVFDAADKAGELLEAADPDTKDQTQLERLIAVGLTAAEAQIILEQLDRCLKAESEGAQ